MNTNQFAQARFSGLLKPTVHVRLCQFCELHQRTRNYYEVLGVNRHSTQKEIKAKYLELARKYHPDAVASKSDADRDSMTKHFQEIQSAYQVLNNEISRREYDASHVGAGQTYNSGYNQYGRYYQRPSESGQQGYYDHFRRYGHMSEAEREADRIHEQRRQQWQEGRNDWFDRGQYEFYNRRGESGPSVGPTGYGGGFPRFKQPTVLTMCILLVILGFVSELLHQNGKIQLIDDRYMMMKEREHAIRSAIDRDRQRYFDELERQQVDYERSRGAPGTYD